MAVKRILPIILLFMISNDLSAQSVQAVKNRFMGREVTIIDPGRDPDGFFPKGPASVCVEGPPQRQCYTAPQEFGNNPTIDVVQLEKDLSALLF
jgi:hypothetical protein